MTQILEQQGNHNHRVIGNGSVPSASAAAAEAGAAAAPASNGRVTSAATASSRARAAEQNGGIVHSATVAAATSESAGTPVTSSTEVTIVTCSVHGSFEKRKKRAGSSANIADSSKGSSVGCDRQAQSSSSSSSQPSSSSSSSTASPKNSTNQTSTPRDATEERGERTEEEDADNLSLYRDLLVAPEDEEKCPSSPASSPALSKGGRGGGGSTLQTDV